MPSEILREGGKKDLGERRSHIEIFWLDENCEALLCIVGLGEQARAWWMCVRPSSTLCCVVLCRVVLRCVVLVDVC